VNGVTQVAVNVGVAASITSSATTLTTGALPAASRPSQVSETAGRSTGTTIPYVAVDTASGKVVAYTATGSTSGVIALLTILEG
jgi:hypothetical protein